MNIVITENQSKKVYQIIYKYIDEMIPNEDVMLEFMTDNELDDEIDWDEDYLTNLTTHIGAYTDDYDSIFRIYLENYFSDEEEKSKTPLLILEFKYSDTLNGLFGIHWHKPMADWLKSNFDQLKNIDIKTIE